LSITTRLGAPVLQAVTDGQEELQVSGASTLGEVLKGIEEKFPQIKDHLYDKDGQLKSTYDVYVNGEGLDPITLSARIKDGDEVTLTMFFCFPRSGQ
jgi:molybdopterin converting factor small subunit